MQGLLGKYTEKLVKIIHNHLPGCKIYLFGIKLKDTPKLELELNLAVDASGVSDLSVIGNIYSDIKKELLPIDADIVDLNNVSDNLREKVLGKGVKLS